MVISVKSGGPVPIDGGILDPTGWPESSGTSGNGISASAGPARWVIMPEVGPFERSRGLLEGRGVAAEAGAAGFSGALRLPFSGPAARDIYPGIVEEP